MECVCGSVWLSHEREEQKGGKKERGLQKIVKNKDVGKKDDKWFENRDVGKKRR